jgi:hypothetical protein
MSDLFISLWLLSPHKVVVDTPARLAEAGEAVNLVPDYSLNALSTHR